MKLTVIMYFNETSHLTKKLGITQGVKGCKPKKPQKVPQNQFFG